MNLIPLEKNYINLASAYLENFKWKKDGLANCRCALCGDSKKKQSLARGYFYLSKHRRYRYKCHNCGANISLVEFMKQICPAIHKEYQLDYMKEMKFGGEYMTSSESVAVTTKPKTVHQQASTLDTLDCIQPIKTLPVFHPAYKYLIHERKIPRDKLDRLFYTRNLNHLLHRLATDFGYGNVIDEDIDEKYPTDERIIIPSISRRTGEMIGFSSRSMSSNSSLRYITAKLSTTEPNIFGFDRVNLNKTVYCCEGQLDSLYLPNCVAVGGSGLRLFESVLSPTEHNIDVVYIHDNQPRNREIVNEIRKTIKSGNKTVIWRENSCHTQGKDIGDMIEHGMEIDEMLFEINNRTFSGVRARIEFGKWAKL